MFNFVSYISYLHFRNKLVQKLKLVFATCSGEGQLQGAIQQFRNAPGFIIANDVCTGGTRKINGCWFQRRQFSFFILQKFNFNDEDLREEALDNCREIRRQFISKMLSDMSEKYGSSDTMLKHMNECNVNFDMDDIRSTEFPDLQLNNCTGLYVLVNLDEPINVAYNGDEWV